MAMPSQRQTLVKLQQALANQTMLTQTFHPCNILKLIQLPPPYCMYMNVNSVSTANVRNAVKASSMHTLQVRRASQLLVR